ncbi:hypothetical protein FM106_15120 [Brachybacterium faecium]|nr:hypothetical protein FM106_15120 [Brachybacterium faecium]
MKIIKSKQWLKYYQTCIKSMYHYGDKWLKCFFIVYTTY